MSDKEFNGVKVFSATMVRDRQELGEVVTDWIRSHPDCKIVDRTITQSSDSQFHCITITLFYWQEPMTAKKGVPSVIQQEPTAKSGNGRKHVEGPPPRVG